MGYLEDHEQFLGENQDEYNVDRCSFHVSISRAYPRNAGHGYREYIIQ
jgi:hypothetical protein